MANNVPIVPAGAPVTNRCLLEGLRAICAAIESQSSAVTPGDGWQSLFESALTNALGPYFDSLEAALQEICDKLENGITVNAVQSGTWTVDANLTPEAISELVAAIEAGGPYSVTVEDGQITATLDQASLDALENITVTVDTSAGPVDVTGSVTIDQSGGPLQVEVTNFPATISIDNFQDLIDGLDSLNVTIDNTDPITVELTQEQLDALTDIDDTDDDIRPVALQCFCWTDTTVDPPVLNKFMGYGKVAEDGSFAGVEVVSGSAPPAGVEFECLETKLLDTLINGECPTEPTLVSDLGVAKLADNDNPSEGDTVVFTVGVTNLGPDDDAAVVVTDLLPAGLTFVSATTTAGSATATAESDGSTTVVWDGFGLIDGGGAEMQLTATVDAATAGQTIINNVSVTGANSDPNTSNNSGTEEINVATGPSQTCYQTCDPATDLTPGPNNATYIQRSGTGLANPDSVTDPAAFGNGFFNTLDADGIPSIDPTQAFSTENVASTTNFNFEDPSNSGTNDYHESTGFVAVPPSACFGGANEMLVRGWYWGNSHQSVWAANSWVRSDLQEFGRMSEDSFVNNNLGLNAEGPIVANEGGIVPDYWTGPSPMTGIHSVPLGSGISPLTVHVNVVDERQAADTRFEYSVDGGTTWQTIPREWIYADPADAAAASATPVNWSCVNGNCTPDNGGAADTEANVQAAGGVVVPCP